MKKLIVSLVLLVFFTSSCSTVSIIQPKVLSDVDNGELELVIAGEGSPTIVLLHGYGSDIDVSWEKTYPAISEISSTVVYNRFNYGNSSSVDIPQTGNQVIKSLKYLLEKEGINSQIILIGHSIGGLYANLYAREYSQDVAGVVLIDSSHPDQMESFEPSGLIKMMYWLDATFNPRRHTEYSYFSETANQIKAAPNFPNIPLTILTAGKFTPSWAGNEELLAIHHDFQKDLTTLSPKGKQTIIKDSGHYIQNESPESVIKAIREMVDIIRNTDENN